MWPSSQIHTTRTLALCSPTINDLYTISIWPKPFNKRISLTPNEIFVFQLTFDFCTKKITLQIPFKYWLQCNVTGDSYPDFVGFAICLLMTAVLAYGVQCSARFNNVLNAISLVIWLFIVGVGVFFAKGSNWNDFTPYGTSGVSACVLSPFISSLSNQSIKFRAKIILTFF